MRILHVNVRLLEGGAAGVARDLHMALLGKGVESKFAYGWGERGGRSSIETIIPNCFQVGSQVQVAANIILHRIIGIDVFNPLAEGSDHLRDAISWADVIHLHVIHSYYLPFRWFFKLLLKENKPIVWTAHDYWMLTGRCAFTEGCSDWISRCGKCPTQKNYPPSYLNLSSNEYESKQSLLHRFGNKLRFVAPTLFVAEGLKIGFPDLSIEVIPNWIDAEFCNALSQITLPETSICIEGKPKIKVLVIANDLSDCGKVDPLVVSNLQKMTHVEVHTVGSNSPFISGNIVNHGKIVKRADLVSIMMSSDLALFTSEKDTFGLVMIEALACGTPVLAVNSLASREVLLPLDIQPILSKSAIVDYIASGTLPDSYKAFDADRLQSKTLAQYSRDSATMRYLEVYKKASK